MAQQTAGIDAGPGTYGGTRWALRVAFGVQAAMAVSQPILAGSYLSGNLDAISIHSAIGGNLTPVAFLVLLSAVAHRWPGRGPLWPVVAMAVLLVLIVVQANAGYSRSLGLHIPLGVAIVGSTVALFVWSVVGRRPRPDVGPAAPETTPSASAPS